MDGLASPLPGNLQELECLLARIDALTCGIDERLRKLEIETAEIKGRVSQLPTIWPLFTGGVGIIFAAIGFTFLVVRFSTGH